MNTKFHPETELLVEYAAGSLSMAKAMMISLHLQQCPACQQRVKRLETLGGELFAQLDTLPEDSVSDSLWQQTLAAIAKPKDATLNADGEQRKPKTNLLQRIAPQGFDQLHWQGIGPVKTAKLALADDDLGELSLLRIKAGARIPVHHHQGEEWTLVLQGGFSDGFGNYHQGDFVARADHDQHSPTAAANEDCICITYVENPLRFHGPLSPIYRLLSKL